MTMLFSVAEQFGHVYFQSLRITVLLFPALDTLKLYITTNTACFAFSALFWAPTG